VKWYNEEVTDGQEHHALQGNIGNGSKEKDGKCSGTSSVLDTSRVLDSNQHCNCENIVDIVNKRSPKRPRKLPVTRNKDFLWTNISKK
jgi:hypothetical protein